ncbi:MAG TPA: hypothetical protein VFZ61_23755, partial [Polyangiales bacterium]
MRSLILTAWLLWLAASARADPPPPPFEPEQLASALRARVPTWVQSELQWEPVPSGSCTLRLRGTERVLDLEGARGSEAARLVAMNALDMASVIAETRSVPPPAAPPVEAPAPVPSATRRPRRQPSWARLGLDLGTLRGGYDRDFWSFELGLRGNLAFWRHLIVGAQLGYWVSPLSRPYYANVDLRWHALAMRAWLGARVDVVELAAGPLLTRYWVQPERDEGFVPGVGGYLGVTVPVARHLETQVRAQFDWLAVDENPYSGFPIEWYAPHY